MRYNGEDCGSTVFESRVLSSGIPREEDDQIAKVGDVPCPLIAMFSCSSGTHSAHELTAIASGLAAAPGGDALQVICFR